MNNDKAEIILTACSKGKLIRYNVDQKQDVWQANAVVKVEDAVLQEMKRQLKQIEKGSYQSLKPGQRLPYRSLSKLVKASRQARGKA